MLDIFNRKVKIVNEELRKQLEERDTLIEWWREEGKRLEKEVNFKTKEVIRQIRRIKELTTETSVLKKRVEDIEKENKTTAGALDISIKAGVEKDKEIARLKNQIKEIEKKENEDRRELLYDVVAMDRENKQLREEIEELKSARFERTKATYDAIRDDCINRVNIKELTTAPRYRTFAITPANIETFRMLRGMALNGRNKRIRNKYINKMAESMEAIFKVITEQGDEITE